MKLYNKEELKDSRLFFDTTPPSYLSWLGFFFVGVLVLGFLSLRFIPKNYVVRAQGTIEANDKAYITPLANGHVVEIHKQEGEFAKKGEKLLTLSAGTEGVQENEITKQIEELKQKQVIFDKYEKSLNEKTNYLASKGKEQEFYGKVAYYLSQVQEDKRQENTKTESTAEKQKELAKLEEEIEKIKEDNHTEYSTQISRKNNELKRAKNKKETLNNQLNSAQKNNEDTSQIKVEIETVDEQIRTLNNEIEDSTRDAEKKLETDLKSKNDEIKTKKQEIKELSSQSQAQSENTKQ
ncbi:hypothetical protein SAMN02745116_02338 [Pilibacter termitis]|uniref:Biotin-lipoyl like n=1 Tax=Pilibacter termitis TaxID=263852 RepID=A0A1T4QVL4_9ENTE|nr:hypothetical protein [Pilibacter termitis]SKA07744.1 hypothetical protein SAMN02745116_02338 [Pilibacter termitis]